MGTGRTLSTTSWWRNEAAASSPSGAEACAVASSAEAIRILEILMSDPLAILPRLDGIFHFIPIGKMDEALKLGWMPLPALEGTHHGVHAVLCHWVCDCEMRVP
jgi:hypothetical protein